MIFPSLCAVAASVWLRLKSFVLQQDPNASEEVLYMCKYCKPLIKKNKLPPRCVLNGLQMEPIPPELADLDSLSRQLIQRAKCYQIVVRHGTCTAKVPIYNSLKVVKSLLSNSNFLSIIVVPGVRPGSRWSCQAAIGLHQNGKAQLITKLKRKHMENKLVLKR